MRCFLEFTEKRIDCAKAEEGLKTAPNSECALNALAIDNPLEYARLYLGGTMQMWIDVEDSWKCGNFIGGLLWISSPPFIKTLVKYRWNARNMRDTIGSEI